MLLMNFLALQYSEERQSQIHLIYHIFLQNHECHNGENL